MLNFLSGSKTLTLKHGDVVTARIGALLRDASVEIMPRTASKIEDFHELFPKGTRIYIAHIAGTPIGDMVATARRLREAGFAVMPHFPARSIRDRAELREWIDRYQAEAGVDQGLILAGDASTPLGTFDSSMQLLDTGLFEETGFRYLHVAGHPEGNRSIDPDKDSRNADAALFWKQEYARHSRAEMAIVTQFCFSMPPVLGWIKHLRTIGISLPIHLGVAGPTKLQTLIKYAVTSGVGPSLSVLQRRATDLGQLVKPYEPTQLFQALLEDSADIDRALLPDAIHMFPFGGIKASADYLMQYQQVG
ncbi:methylenetetrahydrofolate reductase [Phyllobacterium sp. YR531]|uniref:methylenetetrahydrofolate reductase n=1 Tax=Phyllobacterium sp. YR531 TaxID=1144343 RepID=UPI0002F9DF2D|nr:methylenetetrahydrofolate reductase [Phyllobacterium sp. YR531]